MPHPLDARLRRLESRAPANPLAGAGLDALALRVWLSDTESPAAAHPRNPDGSPMTMDDLIAAVGGLDAVEPDSLLAHLAGLEAR
jgi:hypothetical protein